MRTRKKRAERELVTCKTCSKVFEIYVSSHRKYCSVKCSDVGHINIFSKELVICKHCGKEYRVKKRNLNAHHIKPYIDYPELRHDIDNGITFCVPCHIEEHKKDKAIV